MPLGLKEEISLLQESERKFTYPGVIHVKRMQNGLHVKVASAREFRGIHRYCAVVIAGKQWVITLLEIRIILCYLQPATNMENNR